MPQYDMDFAEKLSQIARLVLENGVEETEDQRAVLYLSLLSTEIALKAMLEKAGNSVVDIRRRSHDLAGLLNDLSQNTIVVELAPGEIYSVSASRIRAVTLQQGAAVITVGGVIDNNSGNTSDYPNKIRYGERLRHYSPDTVVQLSEKVVAFARSNWNHFRQ
jgi:hypothetical protein